jgi:hypothetical protein
MHLLFSWVNSRFTCSRLNCWKSQAKNPPSNWSPARISRSGSGKLKSKLAFQRSKACEKLTKCGPNSSTNTSLKSSAGLKNAIKRTKSWWASKLRFRRWQFWLGSLNSHSCSHSSRTSPWLCRQILPNQTTTQTGKATAVASLKPTTPNTQVANNFRRDLASLCSRSRTWLSTQIDITRRVPKGAEWIQTKHNSHGSTTTQRHTTKNSRCSCRKWAYRKCKSLGKK